MIISLNLLSKYIEYLVANWIYVKVSNKLKPSNKKPLLLQNIEYISRIQRYLKKGQCKQKQDSNPLWIG